MQPFTSVAGPAAGLPDVNIDTDVIIPAHRMAAIVRERLGENAFGDRRYDRHGREIPDFILNRVRNAVILVAGRNFGCGSSREHAVWALLDFGIRVVIAPSYGAIFYENCFKNGLLAVVLAEPKVERLLRQLDAAPGATMAVDLESCSLRAPDGEAFEFAIGAAQRQMLLEGLDPIMLTLKNETRINAFQDADRRKRPWVWRRGV